MDSFFTISWVIFDIFKEPLHFSSHGLSGLLGEPKLYYYCQTEISVEPHEAQMDEKAYSINQETNPIVFSGGGTCDINEKCQDSLIQYTEFLTDQATSEKYSQFFKEDFNRLITIYCLD
ncbi:hypothetical protein ACTFIR_002302 [Dictyostelium discoideum]